MNPLISLSILQYHLLKQINLTNKMYKTHWKDFVEVSAILNKQFVVLDT